MNISRLFSAKAREASGKSLATLDARAAQVSELLGRTEIGPVFLSGDMGDFTCAQSVKSIAVVFFDQEWLDHVPGAILLTVAVHEAVHLQLGCEIREAVHREHPDALSLLHSIIGNWLERKIEIWSDDDYILAKGWRGLYDGWVGPTEVDIQKASDAAINYFESLKLGLVSLRDRRVFSAPPKLAKLRPEKLKLPLLDLYREAAQETAAKIVTGFHLVQELIEDWAAASCDKQRVDVGGLEEGFANYLSASLTGVSFEDLQRWAPQDPGKIHLAQRMQRKFPSPPHALRNLRSYGDLVDFWRAAGLIALAEPLRLGQEGLGWD